MNRASSSYLNFGRRATSFDSRPFKTRTSSIGTIEPSPFRIGSKSIFSKGDIGEERVKTARQSIMTRDHKEQMIVENAKAAFIHRRTTIINGKQIKIERTADQKTKESQRPYGLLESVKFAASPKTVKANLEGNFELDIEKEIAKLDPVYAEHLRQLLNEELNTQPPKPAKAKKPEISSRFRRMVSSIKEENQDKAKQKGSAAEAQSPRSPNRAESPRMKIGSQLQKKTTQQNTFDSLVNTLASSKYAEAINMMITKLNKNKEPEKLVSFQNGLRRGTIDPRGKESDLVKMIHKGNRLSFLRMKSVVTAKPEQVNPEGDALKAIMDMRRKDLEAKLGITEELTKEGIVSFVGDSKRVIDKLTGSIQVLLKRFIEQSKQSFFQTIDELINFIFFQIRPINLIADFAELIVAILYGYSELGQCIWCCDKISDLLFTQKLYHRLIFFYEYKAKALHSQVQISDALKCYFKMLFVALHCKDYLNEMRAYEGIGQEYFELGEIDRGKYFHDKARLGYLEPDDSEIRTLMPSMRFTYNQLHKDMRIPEGKKDLSPDLKFYEQVPLDGSHRLLEFEEARKELYNKDFSYIRSLHKNGDPKVKPEDRFFILKNKPSILVLPDKILRSSIAMSDNKIGEINYHKEGLRRENSHRYFNLRDNLNFDNNTDALLKTHRSQNRSVTSFNRHHDMELEVGQLNYKKYQTYLTESGLLLIIKKLNKCGLQLEKHEILIKDYINFSRI